MYTCSQRSLGDIEREHLNDRVRKVCEQISEAGAKVVGLTFCDAFAVFAGIMTLLGKSNDGVGGIIAGSVMAVVLNFILFVSIMTFISCRRERRMLEEALVDGIAMVEQGEATSAVFLSHDGVGRVDPHRRWRIGGCPGPLLRKRQSETSHVRTGRRVALSRMLSYHQGASAAPGDDGPGLASLPVPLVKLTDLVADSAARRAVAAFLSEQTLFPGCLANLAQDLPRLVGRTQAPEAVPDP